MKTKRLVKSYRRRARRLDKALDKFMVLFAKNADKLERYEPAIADILSQKMSEAAMLLVGRGTEENFTQEEVDEVQNVANEECDPVTISQSTEE